MTEVKDRADATGAVPGHADQVGVDVLDGGAPPDARRPSILGRVWRFFISMRTGLVIILILGVLTLLGTVLMQATPEAMAQPEIYQQWYETGPKLKYGGWAPILNALGLFHVFSTWYFQTLFLVLALSILACSINRAPRLWRTATKPRTSMAPEFYERAPLHATIVVDADPKAAAERVRAAFRRRHFRVLEGESGNKRITLYADKFRWAPFGTVVAHLSFVIILAGFVVSALPGYNFKESSFIAPVGVPVPVGHGTGLTVEALSFTDSYYPDGTPKDYVSDLVLTKDGVQVARQETRVNTPLIYDGVWFHQAFFGVGADITVTKGGTTLYSQTVPLQWTSDDGQQSIGSFAVPNSTITVWVIEAASGQKLSELPAGTAALEIHTSDTATPVLKTLTQGSSVTVDGVEYTFSRNRQYTGLSVNRDSGSPIVWTGSILLILGSFLVFFLPFRRVWVRIRPTAEGGSTIQLGATIKRDPAFEPKFADIVSSIESTDTDVSDKE